MGEMKFMSIIVGRPAFTLKYTEPKTAVQKLAAVV